MDLVEDGSGRGVEVEQGGLSHRAVFLWGQAAQSFQHLLQVIDLEIDHFFCLCPLFVLLGLVECRLLLLHFEALGTGFCIVDLGFANFHLQKLVVLLWVQQGARQLPVEHFEAAVVHFEVAAQQGALALVFFLDFRVFILNYVYVEHLLAVEAPLQISNGVELGVLGLMQVVEVIEHLRHCLELLLVD